MKDEKHMGMSWWRFAAMIATSTSIMFFLMYQLVYELDHAMFSINRFVSFLLMGAVMTVVMLAFMWGMYKGALVKVAVIGLGLVSSVGLLVTNRTQALVGDRGFMKSMIPHHFIAINNARRADISDPRVRELADQIIASQVREIAEMKALLSDIEHNGERGSASLPPRQANVTSDTLSKARAARAHDMPPRSTVTERQLPSDSYRAALRHGASVSSCTLTE